MKFQTPLIWAGVILAVALAYYRFSWAGVALVLGGLVFWLLLHFTRLVAVLGRAANAPMGYVASAVMLSAKLKPGVSLLHVMAMTRSLGLLQSEIDVQPEVYRWTDNGGSHVTATFVDGKLTQHALWRPEPTADAADQTHPA